MPGMAARTTVTLISNVPADQAASLGLPADEQQAGDVLSLPHSDALSLVTRGVATFGLRSAAWVAPAQHGTTVTLTADVPSRLADSLGLASTDRQAGDVLSLPYRDALALVQAGVAAFGSAAEDSAGTPTVATPTAATVPTTDADREKYIPARLSAPELRAAYAPNLARIFHVDSYGADPTGAADSTAAFVAANAAAHAAVAGGATGADVGVGAGRYKLTCGRLDLTSPLVGIVGAGAEASRILAQGSGVAVQARNTGWVSDNTIVSRRIGGFTIDGSATTAASVGLRYQDLNAGHLDDLRVRDFGIVGSVGIDMHKDLGWTERVLWTRVTTRNCNTHVCFDGKDSTGGSFMYHRILDLRSTLFVGQTGIKLRNFAQLDNVVFNWVFNALADAGSDILLFNLGDGVASDTSRMLRAQLAVHGERGGAGASLTKDFTLGTNTQFIGAGTIYLVGTWTAGTVSAGNVYFAGQTNAPALSSESFYAGPGFKSVTPNSVTQPATRVRALSLTDTSATVRSTLYSGNGDPNGARFANPGDFYFRNGAPATSLSRIYINTGGANGNSTWTGIL